MTEENGGRIQYSSSLAGRWENALSLNIGSGYFVKERTSPRKSFRRVIRIRTYRKLRSDDDDREGSRESKNI